MILLTSILKITGLLDLASKELRANGNKILEGGGKADDRNLSKSKNSKNAKSEI